MGPDEATGGDRSLNGRAHLRRRNIEGLTGPDAVNVIEHHVSRRGRIDRTLQAREQECEGFGVDPHADQPWKRPGAYDWRHRYAENPISQALRHTLRRKVGSVAKSTVVLSSVRYGWRVVRYMLSMQVLDLIIACWSSSPFNSIPRL